MKYIICGIFLLGLFIPNSEAQTIQREDFVFRSGRNVLTARIIYPESTNPLPFLIYVGGEEAFQSYNKDYRDFLQQNVEDVLLPEGYGMIYINTRGVNGSDGKWQRADFEDRARDIEEAFNTILSRKEVDPERLAIFGHGTGTYIAQIVAARNTDKIDALISLAGAPFSMRLKVLNGYHSRYVCSGKDSVSAYKKAERQTRSSMGWVTTFPVIKKWRQSKVTKDFDPSDILKNLEMPTLFILAENDKEVYPDWANTSLNEIFNENIPDNFTITTVPLTNHYFQVAEKCYDGSRSSLPYSDVFKTELRNWVVENL